MPAPSRERESRKRLWKADWYDPHWADRLGASYTIREHAIHRVQSQIEEGCFDGRVWQVNERGEAVGSIIRIGDPAT